MDECHSATDQPTPLHLPHHLMYDDINPFHEHWHQKEEDVAQQQSEFK